MTEWTDEALEQYARRVLTDALRAEWDDAEQKDAFAASKRYRREMQGMLANPEAWYRKKAQPPWKRHARRLSALAALAAVVFAAVWYLPNAGEAAAQASAAPLSAGLAALALILIAAGLTGRMRKK